MFSGTKKISTTLPEGTIGVSEVIVNDAQDSRDSKLIELMKSVRGCKISNVDTKGFKAGIIRLNFDNGVYIYISSILFFGKQEVE